MNQLDTRGAALYALVAVALVLVGAALVAPSLSIEQRAAILTTAAAVLALLGYRGRRDPPL